MINPPRRTLNNDLTINPWDSRPLFRNLPQEGYQDNEVVDWFTGPWDILLLETKDKIDDTERQLDPMRCDPQWLDYLAALAGFTGLYWNKAWKDSIKRQLIQASLSFLWENRGTEQALEFVLTVFLGANNYDVWREGEFQVEVSTLDAELGEPEYRYFVRVPIAFQRDGEQFRTAALMNQLYGAAYCDSDVVYDGFYTDYSIVGDVIFEENDAINL